MIRWSLRSPWRFFGVYFLLVALLGLGASALLPTLEAGPGGLGLAQLALQALLTLLQVLFAGMTGVGFAAVTLRTGSLWPAIVLHAGYHLAFRVGAFEPFGAFSNAYYMLNGVGWVLFALVVLRPTALARGRIAAS